MSCGSQNGSIVSNASVGSMNLADSDVSYKKNEDGARSRFSINTGVYAGIPLGGTVQVTLSTSDYNKVFEGDIFVNSSLPNYSISILTKDGNNKVTLKNMGLATSTDGQNQYLATTIRSDGLFADIIDKKDIIDGQGQDLRHLVSLNGFNYDTMSTQYFDQLCRNEL
jgi:hypothetical protein